MTSSFACVICALTVSCDSCKVFLKRRPARTLQAARRKICRLWCLCVKWLISLSICWHFRIIYFKPAAFKSVKTDFLIRHISHVATSKMSEMSFALNKKLPEMFKGALDDCFNLERLLMISSQLHFYFFFFYTSQRQRVLPLKVGWLFIWILETIIKRLQQLSSCCCPGLLHC